MMGHIGTNARPNLYPLAGDDRALTLLKRGCANSVVGLELAEPRKGNGQRRKRLYPRAPGEPSKCREAKVATRQFFSEATPAEPSGELFFANFGR